MKKLFLLCALAILTVGCKPYDTPEFIEIDTSETGFLIPLEDDSSKQTAFESAELLEKRKVAVKRVQIPHRWVQTSRMYFNGEYVDTVRLIKVDRQPVTREWTAEANVGTSNRNEAIWVESSDSVGFSVGFSCTAYVKEEDASKFLYHYTAKQLPMIMDTEIRAKIQEAAAEFCARYPLDDLRALKTTIVKGDEEQEGLIQYVRKTTISFFESRGISVTTVGMFGGFTYENKAVQDAIDKTVQDQQLKVSAEARKEAQAIENLTIKLAAEGKADAIRAEAQGEADAIRKVAEAKAYEIEQAMKEQNFYLELKNIEVEKLRLEKWDGSYPQYLMQSGGESPSLLLEMPTPQKK